MVDLLIRNVKPATKTALAERARANGRSMQVELTSILDQVAQQPVSRSGSQAPQILDLVMGHGSGSSNWGRDDIYQDAR